MSKREEGDQETKAWDTVWLVMVFTCADETCIATPRSMLNRLSECEGCHFLGGTKSFFGMQRSAKVVLFLGIPKTLFGIQNSFFGKQKFLVDQNPKTLGKNIFLIFFNILLLFFLVWAIF